MAVPTIPEIVLHSATPTSGLRRLVVSNANPDPEPPYWAYNWAGGAVLARYFLDHPEVVRGQRVLDLGSGSGIVGIAAAKAGAIRVIAAETDRNAIVAQQLNAALNGVVLTSMHADLTTGPALDVDFVAVGDLFYAPHLAQRVLGFLDRCLLADAKVLVGDPGRADLPRARLQLIGEYSVPDFGLVTGATINAGVFALI
ncbi:class I SAM-dependent methyltransferase [Phyllobacterium myrsinacearum]|uniref:Putative nicotinamide N-methyase n=1 Tax=Phyllobacterium myrsinacearum TaxID=28101 RepID=A0A839ELB2_9HYPH|nr:putative nicotinamide N-methyase [Phyllobacterium myrsinacearum]